MENPNEKKRKRCGGDEAAAADGAASPSSTSFDRDIYPNLFAAAAAGVRTSRADQQTSSSTAGVRTSRADQHTPAAAARLLRRLLAHPTLLSPLPRSLVEVLPLLLVSRSHSVAALSCEVLGAAALQSMEASETLASDGGITGGLACALGNGSQRVAEAACNAVLDLSASSVASELLSSSPVLPKLLHLFSQMKSISHVVDRRIISRPSRLSKLNKFLYLIIDTVVLMVNSCKVVTLSSLKQELVRKFLPLLYEIWDKVRLSRPSADCKNWKDQLQSREYEMSEAIFRLTMDLTYPAHLEPDEVRKFIFGQQESDFQNFVLTYWEKSTYLYRRKQDVLKENPVFAAMHNAFDLRTSDAIIESFVHGLVSCPAIASDELDMDSFLHEVHDSLGAGVKYKQDVRVVRTRDQTSKEFGMAEHFFVDGTLFPDAAVFSEKCKDAFKKGFTIALRGMEFRSEKIASIASALADLFGQPSVGANIYFSPPRSQGLARHYDDHCVLVWQLLGHKKWIIWPNTRSILPRLYEPFDSLDDLMDGSGGKIQVLHEGDIMYVPRGYVHEAHAGVDGGESEVSVSADYSLHLTLAIEVEPPFEWEGFAHIALHCWLEEQKLVSSQVAKSKAGEQAPLFAFLLHVAIRLLSDNDPIFRKACMVAAKLPSSSNSCPTTHLEALRSSQRSTFTEIINKIDKSCSFKEALRCIKLAVESKTDQPFQWMSWLRHLPQRHGDSSGGGSTTRINFYNVLGALEELVEAFSSNIEQALVGFMDFKSEFCRTVVYEEACKNFKWLLQMYRATRNQYMKGMLALHGEHGGWTDWVQAEFPSSRIVTS